MGGERGKGVNVGGVYYDVAVDTQKLIEAERQTDRSAAKMATSLTAVAEASKIHATAAGLAATAVREAARAADSVADANAKAAASAKAAAKATDQQAMSAKALAAAQRNVPAQVTDIVTGLAAGQSPLTVLLQQGGQLKDMFGGVGNAARALGGYIAGLVSPFTLAAAAAGTLLLGWVKGRDEIADFNRTLAETGNQSGVTAGQLNGMAANLGAMADITRGKAAEALNVMVKAGITGEAQLTKFTQAAIRLEQAGGPAVEKTAKAFADLQKDPLSATLKLNDGLNYLTESTYRQIKALIDQGRQVEAATVAQNAYADAVLQRTPKITENLGLVEKAWRGVAGAAKWAWDAVLNVGREDAPDKIIAKTRSEIERLEKALASGGFANTGGGAAVGGGMDGATRKRLEAELAARKEELHTLNRTALVQQEVAATEANRKTTVEALAQFDKAGEKFLTDKVKMEREIAAAKELGRQAGLSELEIQQRIAAIQKSYADKNKKQPFDSAGYLGGLEKAAADGYAKIDAIEREGLRKNQELLKEGKISRQDAAKAAVLIEEDAARERLKISKNELTDLKKEIKSNGKEVADLEKQYAAERARGVEYAAQLTRAVNPIDALRQEYEAKLQLVTTYEQLMAQAGVDATAQGEMARTEITRQYELQRQALAEQSFRSQSDANAFLIDSLNSLSQSATSSIMGLINGTMTAQDAMRGLANTVLNQAVGALVQMGIQQVKNALTAKTLEAAEKARAAAKGAVYAASVSAQVAGMSAMAAQNAFAATAAIPIIGPALAPAAAATAGAAAAAIGAPAIATAPLAGARQYGGPVDSGGLYRVGEGNRPEMFVGDSGRSYMIPGERGKVVGNGDLGGGALAPIVNIYQAPAETTTRTSRDSEGRWVVDVMLNAVADDMASGGKVARATQSRFNLRA